MAIFTSNHRIAPLKEPQTIKEEFELLKELEDLSVKDFHVIQLADKESAALELRYRHLVFNKMC